MNNKATRAERDTTGAAAPTGRAGTAGLPTVHQVDRLRSKGRLQEAREACLRLVDANPQFARAVFLLGIIEQQMGNSEKSVELMRRTIELQPDFADAHVNLGVAYRSLNKIKSAEKAIREGLALEPNRADSHSILGAILAHAGKWIAAENAYRHALTLNPNHARTFNNLGVLMARQERNVEAEEAYRRALEIRPGYVDARFNLSTVHRYFPGDPEIEALKSALGMDGLLDIQRTKMKFALGKAHDAIGDYATAFEYFRQGNAEMARRGSVDEDAYRRRMEGVRAIFESRPVLSATPPPKSEHIPIFIVGPSRSGKTLIESLLTRGAESFRAGERRDLVEAESETARRYSLNSRFPAYLEKLDAGMLSEIGESYLKKVAALEPDARSSVNTLPGHYAHVGVIVESLPRAKVIFCRRNAMDCCMRIFFHYYRSRNEHTYDQESVARYYARYWGLLDFWKARYGEHVLEVRYEELVSRPDATVPAIFDFCGLDDAPAADTLDFRTDEIDHWRHYEAELQPMVKTLGQVAPGAAPR